MVTPEDLKKAEYITLETYYPSGRGVKTPVWNVYEDGKLFVWTGADSYKVKRIKQNENVKVCISDATGKPLSEWVEARAQVSTNPETLRAQQKRMAAKYGLMYWGFYILGKLRRTKSAVVEIYPNFSVN